MLAYSTMKISEGANILIQDSSKDSKQDSTIFRFPTISASYKFPDH